MPDQIDHSRSVALRFVLLIGVMSFFADFAYEGARSVLGPYLALLGASGAAVGAVAGFGELAGYGLRIVSGRLADRTHQFWPITILGYVVQMAAVPALALTGSWPAAATLLILERAGRATRNPPRDVMLSHAGHQMGGYGWAFGLNEALDQLGALTGPLVIAYVLLRHGGSNTLGGYHAGFAVLVIPAAATLTLLAVARLLYPRPQEMEQGSSGAMGGLAGLPRAFWIYLTGAALVGAGFADFALVAYHFQKSTNVTGVWVPVFYAAAMGVGGAGSLLFGKLFDRYGLWVLIPLTLVSALFAPLVFLGGFWMAFAGTMVWGLGMGVHESIVPAAVAPMAGKEQRASAYGLFSAGYGVAWFAGSALIGFLYDHSVAVTVAACVVLEVAAIPFFVMAARLVPHGTRATQKPA